MTKSQRNQPVLNFWQSQSFFFFYPNILLPFSKPLWQNKTKFNFVFVWPCHNTSVVRGKKNRQTIPFYLLMAASDNIRVKKIPFFEKSRLHQKNMFKPACVYYFFGIWSN